MGVAHLDRGLEEALGLQQKPVFLQDALQLALGETYHQGSDYHYENNAHADYHGLPRAESVITGLDVLDVVEVHADVDGDGGGWDHAKHVAEDVVPDPDRGDRHHVMKDIVWDQGRHSHKDHHFQRIVLQSIVDGSEKLDFSCQVSADEFS